MVLYACRFTNRRSVYFLQSVKKRMAENFANCHARRQAQLNGAARPTRRNREAQLVRATAVNNNMRALEAGIITLRYFLVAVSARINVGEVVADPDVPEMAEEIEVADWAEEVPDAEVEVLLPPAPAPPAASSPPPPPPRAAVYAWSSHPHACSYLAGTYYVTRVSWEYSRLPELTDVHIAGVILAPALTYIYKGRRGPVTV
ncbi:uncharacterized protein LOC125240947 isoform X2 [Leguminivora glycinivorella]|uniref:uncharacterized protein LOC125240947 isoform X2 n=1 Tax=Leguminivora glycinivorella TaxID=1035111 RepID=UPI00200E5265|nr:uncharacterized protein LOC125240947 isoform X2 [Leguminivora glycinivorella]